MDYTYLRFPGFLEKAVTLSYDDGLIYDRRLISIMSEYGLKGTFNLNSMNFFRDSDYHIGRAEAKDLYIGSGNEVAVHGWEHMSIGEEDDAVGINDIIRDRKDLEDLFGVIIKGMAYANGSFDERTSGLLNYCGINYARTTLSTEGFALPKDWLRLNPTCHHDSPRLMDLAKRFLDIHYGGYGRINTPAVLYIWGHSYEFNNNNNWSVIEEFAKYIGGHDDVWYATNGEIFSYVKAYRSLVFSVNMDLVYNPTDTDIYALFNWKPHIIPKGETVVIK